MKKLHKTLGIAAALGIFAMAGNAQAITTTPVSIAGVGTVGAFDWSPGTAYAQGGNAVVTIGPGVATISSFPLYYQAALANFDDPGGTPITGTGLNSSYYITIVAGFSETGLDLLGVPKASGSTALFSIDTTKPSYFGIYKTSTKPDNLAGTGFATGTLLASGTISDIGFVSNFSANNNLAATVTDPIANLDSFSAAGNTAWANQQTVTGGGATDITSIVNYYDPTFFLSQIVELTVGMATNTSDVDPYNQVDPSLQIYDGFTSSEITTIGTLGAINGSLVSGSGNIMFQADANTSFAAVPEPSTFVLSGLGLLLAGGFMRRRRNV